MKTVIEGIVYDTETSEEVASGNHNSFMSNASWTLFRTVNGVFFEIVADHDGAIESVQPLSYLAARKFLEVNANHLVETYFGTLPEAAKPLFSRRTLLAAVDILESKYSQAEISAFFTDLGPAVYEELRDSGSAKSRMTEFKRFIDGHPSLHVDDGLLDNIIVEKAARFVPWPRPEYAWARPSTPQANPLFDRFKYVLSQDGFSVDQGTLRRTLPVDLDLPESTSALEELLQRHGFSTPHGHLKQAMDAFARGNWAGANSQLRSFFEGLTDEIAIRIDPTCASQSSENRRSLLGARGFLSEELNEWSKDGKNYINGLFKRLHPHGSHPGLSDENDSTFRLHIVLVTAILIMRRFDQSQYR